MHTLRYNNELTAKNTESSSKNCTNFSNQWFVNVIRRVCMRMCITKATVSRDRNVRLHNFI
jgi:hypothetical protein